MLDYLRARGDDELVVPMTHGDGQYGTTSSSVAPQTASQVMPQVQIVPQAQEALDVVIATRGNLPLAAERLGYSIQEIQAGTAQAELTRLLTPYLRDLKEYMQTAAVLELFSFMPHLHKTLIANLTALEPGDAVNAYMKLMDQIGKITDDKTLTLNVNDAAWRLVNSKMPKEVIEAYMEEIVAS